MLGAFLISSQPVVAAPAAPPGETLLVPAEPSNSTSGATALSDDGLTAAFEFREFGEGSVLRVLKRTLPGGAAQSVTTEIPAGAEATSPTISGDGSRVGYSVQFNQTRQDDNERERTQSIGDNQLFVGDIPITGTPQDLTYQRTPPCDAIFNGRLNTYCGPRLSGDGRTIAFPALESINSPNLVPRIDTGEGLNTLSDDDNRYLPLLDFGADLSGTTTRSILVDVLGPAVTFSTDGPTLTNSDSEFTIVPNPTGVRPCTGTIGAGQFCHVTIRYAPPECGTEVTSFGTLQTNATTPGGRTAFNLVATGCVSVVNFRSLESTTGDGTGIGEGGGSSDGNGGAGSAAAPPPTGVQPCTNRPSPQPSRGTLEPIGGGAFTGVFGEQPLHSIALQAFTVSNPNYESNVTVDFTSTSCALSLDGSIPDPAGGVPTCRQGAVVGPQGSCTAYVRFEPQEIAPTVANLTLHSTSGFDEATRFSGYGGEQLVLARQDTAGNGGFAGPPIVVSAGDGGTAALQGAEPAVSADGNQIAFSSTCLPNGLVLQANPETPCGSGPVATRQVFLRDLTANTTRLVSILPNGAPATDAFQPSLSGNGNRVAFATLRHTIAPSGGPLTVNDHVFVRDLAAGRTVIASAQAGTSGTAAQPGSAEPSLSRDGSTVAFASPATDLVDPATPASNDLRAYVRDLGPDFGGPGAAGNELLSVGTVDGEATVGDGDHPAVDAVGGMIAFDSFSQLTDTPVRGGEAGEIAYARARFGHTEVNPGALTFPTTPVGSTSAAQPVTITNGGPGPVHVSTGIVGPYQVTGGPCTVLHRGESCVVQVTAAPTEPGPQRGTLQVPNRSDFGDPGQIDVPLTGKAISPLITVSPNRTPFPVQLVGATSRPITVTVTNISTIPLDITGAYAPATPNFRIAQNTCGTLAPGARCTITVTYTPKTVGRHAGTLALTVTNVLHEISFTQNVPATGSTRTPKLAVDPLVVRLGQVAFVTGTDFAPGVAVDITWSLGLGTATVTADALGRFSAALLTMTGDLTGPRNPVAKEGSLPAVNGPVVLVVPGAMQPPDFGNRS